MRARFTLNCNFGKRNLRVARPGNDSARKTLPWLDCYGSDTYAGVDAFAIELLKATWTGALGRQQSADCLVILGLVMERRSHGTSTNRNLRDTFPCTILLPYF